MLTVQTRLLILATSILSINNSYSQGTKKNSMPGNSATSYHLVWSDEFNGHHVDTSVWQFETGGNGWGNHEQEFYQAANATEVNGNLVITAVKESGGNHPYTSSRMRTLGRKSFKYGKIEARMKLPVGLGIWPAFWMMGDDITSVDWPACGETDIMEHINADSTIYGTIHWDDNGHKQSSGHINSTPGDFHVYGVEWDADSIKWFVDNVEFHAANINKSSTEEFHQPFFIIFNLAVGGDWPGQKVDDTLFPAKMYVDYVRVYQKKP